MSPCGSSQPRAISHCLVVIDLIVCCWVCCTMWPSCSPTPSLHVSCPACHVEGVQACLSCSAGDSSGLEWGVIAEPVTELAPVVGTRAVRSFSVARLPLLWTRASRQALTL